MGQQQLLLLIIGVIIVAIAVAVAFGMFGAQSTESNKDGITSKLVNIAADAHQYKLRPKVLGGGRPSFVGYSIPVRMQSDENGRYEIQGAPTETQIVLRGISVMNTSWIATCQVDSNGYTMVSYTGWE